MASYYVSITSFNLGNAALSYLTNESYRITEQTKNVLGDEFWNNYSKVYKKYRENNKLLFRAKIIKDNKVFIKQIWQLKQDRDNFSKEVCEEHFDQKTNFIAIRDFYYLEKSNIDDFINSVLLEEHKILQHVSLEFQRPGMVIGDALKGDVLTHVI